MEGTGPRRQPQRYAEKGRGMPGRKVMRTVNGEESKAENWVGRTFHQPPSHPSTSFVDLIFELQQQVIAPWLPSSTASRSSARRRGARANLVEDMILPKSQWIIIMTAVGNRIGANWTMQTAQQASASTFRGEIPYRSPNEVNKQEKVRDLDDSIADGGSDGELTPATSKASEERLSEATEEEPGAGDEAGTQGMPKFGQQLPFHQDTVWKLGFDAGRTSTEASHPKDKQTVKGRIR
ncbi:MAG: hypothetical protein Q9210_007422 [Variospora velana]